MFDTGFLVAKVKLAIIVIVQLLHQINIIINNLCNKWSKGMHFFIIILDLVIYFLFVLRISEKLLFIASAKKFNPKGLNAITISENSGKKTEMALNRRKISTKIDNKTYDRISVKK